MSWWPPRSRARWAMPAAGVVALLACLALGLAEPRQALLSYLLAWFFFTGLTLGSLALLMVHALTGGRWGESIRPQLLAAARALPVQALLVLPILFGMRTLYLWTQPQAIAASAQLRAQGWYLDERFFVIRTIAWFALWLWLWSAIDRRLRDPARIDRLPALAAGGLIVYALSMSLAATDWVMSLLPQWRSSIFGMLVVTGQMLAAAALATWMAARRDPRSRRAAPDSALLADLGNLLLMFVLAFAYLAFMQYLTVWIADLPAERSWYVPRTLTSWRWLAWFLVAFLFVVPFAVLLSRRAKRMPVVLAAVAAMLLAGSMSHALWLVVPSFRAQGFSLRWTDLFAVLGIGLLWISLYRVQWNALRDLPFAAMPARAGPPGHVQSGKEHRHG